jgi:hypothetical protein
VLRYADALTLQAGHMSALGQKPTYAVQIGMSALPSKADIGRFEPWAKNEN